MSAEKTKLGLDEQRQIVQNAFDEIEREFFRQFGARMIYFNDGQNEFGNEPDDEGLAE